MMNMDIVNVYIKARWKGNLRGSGRAAAIIVFEDREGNVYKRTETTEVEDSSKNRLNLQIITKALHALKRPCSVGIYMDGAENIAGQIKQELPEQWKRSGWKNKKGKEVKNVDVWKLLVPLLKRHEIGMVGYISTFDLELERILEE